MTVPKSTLFYGEEFRKEKQITERDAYVLLRAGVIEPCGCEDNCGSFYATDETMTLGQIGKRLGLLQVGKAKL